MEAQTARRAEENKTCENRFQHLGQWQLAHNKKPLYAGQFQKSQYKCYSWEHSVQVVLEKKEEATFRFLICYMPNIPLPAQTNFLGDSWPASLDSSSQRVS